MHVVCFSCEARIEGSDADEVADRFVAHGAESHEWPYPEEAIRNYAHNYAAALTRLSGDVERLEEIGVLEVYPVDEKRIDDWLEFFDHRGFADNPDWASCYCIEQHLPAPPEMPERPWHENRRLMLDLLRGGVAFGYLAYIDGVAAGWVNASERSSYAKFGSVDPGGPDPSTVIGVSCFVIAPPYRRHGVSAALLDQVIADAGSRGAEWVEGYPSRDPDDGDAGHFRGARSMYEARGFGEVETLERNIVMRRAVAQS